MAADASKAVLGAFALLKHLCFKKLNTDKQRISCPPFG